LNLKFTLYFLITFITVIIFSIFTYTTYSNTNFSTSENHPYYFSNSEFFWPVPGFNTVSSPFGIRTSPTSGASTYHSGIDIPATEGSTIYSVISGKITYIGFYGANGYSIIQENNDLTVIYGHISPNYIISIGDFISKGKKISNIGPKNIYTIENNPYSDNTGTPTNGATTGPHLHLTVKRNGTPINPLTLF